MTANLAIIQQGLQEMARWVVEHEQVANAIQAEQYALRARIQQLEQEHQGLFSPSGLSTGPVSPFPLEQIGLPANFF